MTITPSASLNYIVSTVRVLSDELINLQDKQKFDTMCVSGCPNYERKWSCPPFSPTYSNYAASWKYLYIWLMQIKMKQFSYIKSDYLKIKVANNILKSRADKYLREISLKYGKYISTGSCRLCKPCKRKIGQPCAYSEVKTYSYEAMGIDVNALVERYFTNKLLWYKRGLLPEYTSIVCGLLSNELHSFETLRNEYMDLIRMKKHRSYI
jgi:predicted metal-binding protein